MRKTRNETDSAALSGSPLSAGVTFVAVAAALITVVLTLNSAGVLLPLQEALAAFLGGLLRLAGLDPAVQGTLIVYSGSALDIVVECTGIYLMAVYTALVVAYPSTGRQKGSGLVWGLLAIQAANLIRLLVVGLMVEWWPAALEAAHDYLFQVALVVVTVIVWLVWMDRVRRAEV